MTLQSSGTISLDNIRREFGEGMSNSTTHTDGATSNASLHQYRNQDYYQNLPSSSGSVSANSYYGLNGESGWFIAGRRGSSPAYLWGWKEYAGGQFFWPESGDSASSMGSATTSTQKRMMNKFYVTAVLFGYYYDRAEEVYNGSIFTVYGVENNPNGYSRSARNLQFKEEYNGSTYNWTASSASGLTYNHNSSHSYIATYRLCYKWEGSSYLFSYTKDAMDRSYTYNKKIYWRTY